MLYLPYKVEAGELVMHTYFNVKTSPIRQTKVVDNKNSLNSEYTYVIYSLDLSESRTSLRLFINED